MLGTGKSFAFLLFIQRNGVIHAEIIEAPTLPKASDEANAGLLRH